MNNLSEINEQIKILKSARTILKNKYENTEFHKKKMTNPHTSVPSEPEDEDIYKLLTAIQQLDIYIKELQDEQFTLLKKQE